jgi:tetratricopeptide (TPR) repeat protein
MKMLRLTLIFLIFPLSLYAQSSMESAEKLFKDKKYKKAIAEYSEVIKTKPYSIGAFVGRGDCYYKLENYKAAIEDYSKGLKIDSTDVKLISKRAGSFYMTKEYAKAIEDYSKLITANYKDVSNIYFLRGLCKSLLPTEDVEGACADFRIAKSLGYKTDQLTGLNKYCSVTDLE